MKIKGFSKKETPKVEVPAVWCRKCDIRIAPYDEGITLYRGKIYHTGCYRKMVRPSGSGPLPASGGLVPAN